MMALIFNAGTDPHLANQKMIAFFVAWIFWRIFNDGKKHRSQDYAFFNRDCSDILLKIYRRFFTFKKATIEAFLFVEKLGIE
jgi:hypothetical protein